MGQHDALAFCPHIGIASGIVTIGYVGTPLKYNCSAFGTPLTFANRCTSVKPKESVSCSIVFPANEWQDRNLDEMIPPEKYPNSDGSIQEMPQIWKLLEPRTEKLKNIGDHKIQEIVKTSINIPMTPMEKRAKLISRDLLKAGLYRPILPQW
jgi:hypothetical protein